MSSSKKRTLGDVYRPDVGYQAQPPQQPQPEPPGQKSQRAQKRKQKKSKSSSNTPAHSQGGSYADDEHARRMERAGRFKDDGALAAGAKKNTAKRDDHRRKMLDKVRVFETGPDSAGADDTIETTQDYPGDWPDAWVYASGDRMSQPGEASERIYAALKRLRQSPSGRMPVEPE